MDDYYILRPIGECLDDIQKNIRIMQRKILLLEKENQALKDKIEKMKNLCEEED